jgi:hypothetical protein
MILFGNAIFGGCLSTFNLWQGVYLLFHIRAYVSRTKNHKAARTTSKFGGFVCGFMAILVLEWVGIVLYFTQPHPAFAFSLEILRIRCILIVYIFVQLRDFTLGPTPTTSTIPNSEIHVRAVA